MQCSAAPGGLYGGSHEVLRYHGAAMPEVLPARRNGEMGEIWHGWVRELMLRSAIHEPSSRAALRIHKQRYFVPACEGLYDTTAPAQHRGTSTGSLRQVPPRLSPLCTPRQKHHTFIAQAALSPSFVASGTARLVAKPGSLELAHQGP